MSFVFSLSWAHNKKAVLALLWFVFTTALGAWWVYFSYLQYDSLSKTRWENSNNILRYQKMLIQEGLVFLSLVILGGGALIYYFLKESKLLKERESFFAAFTHDLKTTIATHRLSLENLIQVNRSITPQEHKKMFSESQALGLKLENALLLSQDDRTFGVYSVFSLSEVISSVKRMWPELEVTINKDVVIRADKVFLTSVLMNLFQNAIQHAKASEISVEVAESQTVKNKAYIDICSDGLTFDGDISKLGNSHYYRGLYRGSGLGLFISKSLMKKMNGDLSFFVSGKTLAARLEIQTGELT